MAWEALGGTLNPGETAYWNYSWGGYHGIDIPSVRALTPNAKLICSNYGGRLEQNGTYTYFVDITNVSGFPVTYHLTGTS
jgi:hypothetical protein